MINEFDLKKANHLLEDDEEVEEIEAGEEEVKEAPSDDNMVKITINDTNIEYYWPNGSNGSKPGNDFETLKEIVDDTNKYNPKAKHYQIVDNRSEY